MATIDVHEVLNLMVKEMQGVGAGGINIGDVSSIGVLNDHYFGGLDETLTALTKVIGRTLMAVRPYEAKLGLINTLNSGIFTDRMRKISFYTKDAKASGDYNTDAFHNFDMGYTNGQNDNSSTKSMWEQNPPIPLELQFDGRKVWEYSTTMYQNQIAEAFRDNETFGNFVSAYLQEAANDIEQEKEAFNRIALITKIGSIIHLDGLSLPGGYSKPIQSLVNLTAEFNAEFGTSYTSEQLRTTYLDKFLEFFVARIKIDSQKMRNRTTNYHWYPILSDNTGSQHHLARHTPRDKQRLMLYSPLFVKAEAYVMPTIFNDNYLKIENYEGVDYWQSFNEPTKIDAHIAVPTGDGSSDTATINENYVVGMLYDVDGLMTDFQFEDVNTTPLEARKRYRVNWYTFSKNSIIDPTENTIVYVMRD